VQDATQRQTHLPLRGVHRSDLSPRFDQAEERTSHLDTCQFQTHPHADIPRVQCTTHGVKQVRVPWAEPRSRFTLLMERLVIDLILQCSSVKCASVGSMLPRASPS
jgi:hypothetical protein